MHNPFMKTVPARGQARDVHERQYTVVVSIPHIYLLLHVIFFIKKKKKRKKELNTGQTTYSIHERCAVGVLSHVLLFLKFLHLYQRTYLITVSVYASLKCLFVVFIQTKPHNTLILHRRHQKEVRYFYVHPSSNRHHFPRFNPAFDNGRRRYSSRYGRRQPTPLYTRHQCIKATH